MKFPVVLRVKGKDQYISYDEGHMIAHEVTDDINLSTMFSESSRDFMDDIIEECSNDLGCEIEMVPVTITINKS